MRSGSLTAWPSCNCRMVEPRTSKNPIKTVRKGWTGDWHSPKGWQRKKKEIKGPGGEENVVGGDIIWRLRKKERVKQRAKEKGVEGQRIASANWCAKCISVALTLTFDIVAKLWCNGAIYLGMICLFAGFTLKAALDVRMVVSALGDFVHLSFGTAARPSQTDTISGFQSEPEPEP